MPTNLPQKIQIYDCLNFYFYFFEPIFFKKRPLLCQVPFTTWPGKKSEPTVSLPESHALRIFPDAPANSPRDAPSLLRNPNTLISYKVFKPHILLLINENILGK